MFKLTPLLGVLHYSIARDGRVYSHKMGRFLTCFTDASYGYVRVGLLVAPRKQRLFAVHRLLAQTFLPNPEQKRTVNHKNGLKTDNRIKNLEWATYAENMQHAFRTGLIVIATGARHHGAKLTFSQVEEIRVLRGSDTQIAIGKKFGVSRGCVQAILDGRSWRTAHGKKVKQARGR